MKLTKLTLVDEEELLEVVWDAYYRSNDHGRKAVRKSKDAIPQVVQDVIKIFYGILDEELGSGETRHLIPQDATAAKLEITRQRVKDALARALDRKALQLPDDQPKVGKRYTVNKDLVVVRRLNITTAWELRQHCVSVGKFDLYWEAYKTVRQTMERASLKALLDEMTALEKNGFRA